MTIYLDVVFFMNLLYQFGILMITDILFHMHASKIRILFGAITGSAAYCLWLVSGILKDNFPERVLLGILIGSLSILTAFFPLKGKKIGVLIAAECFLAICLEGVLELFDVGTGNGYLMLTGCGALVFMGLFCLKIREVLFAKIGKEKTILEIRMSHKGRLAFANGLVDTGNGLSDPISKEPVIIIPRSLKEKLLMQERVRDQKGYRLIPYESVGTRKGVLEAFRLEQLVIMDKNQSGKDAEIVRTQVICAVCEDDFCTNGEYEVLLHPLLL